MTAWTPTQLDTIDGADELDIATRRADGTLRTSRIVWVVRHNDQLYVRSVNGRDAAWYRGVQTRYAGHITAGSIEADVTFVNADHTLDDDPDAAYRRKYGRYPGPTNHITAAAARPTRSGLTTRRGSDPTDSSPRNTKHETAIHPRHRQNARRPLHGRRLPGPGLQRRRHLPTRCRPRPLHPGRAHQLHSHANGQLLRCTDGVGLVATRDGTAIRMRAGDTVWTPAGEEHWHGGSPNSMMCHYAILDARG